MPSPLLLVDIEGTTSPIAFVHEVMFPFARRELEGFLERTWTDPATRAASERIAKEAGGEDLASWSNSGDRRVQASRVIEEVHRLMDADTKSTGLKELQGLIWRRGFETGELRAPVFPDVVPALERWHEANRGTWIYSSGSIASQKLFFGHTTEGDLLPWIRGHFDTTTGPKKEAESYSRIARELEREPGDLLFLSDVPAELEAARAAGLEVRLVVRPGNPELDGSLDFEVIETFDGLF